MQLRFSCHVTVHKVQQLPCEVIPALDSLRVALASDDGHVRLTHHRLVGSALLPVLVDEAGVADLVHIQRQRQRNCSTQAPFGGGGVPLGGGVRGPWSMAWGGKGRYCSRMMWTWAMLGGAPLPPPLSTEQRSTER